MWVLAELFGRQTQDWNVQGLITVATHVYKCLTNFLFHNSSGQPTIMGAISVEAWCSGAHLAGEKRNMNICTMDIWTG